MLTPSVRASISLSRYLLTAAHRRGYAAIAVVNVVSKRFNVVHAIGICPTYSARGCCAKLGQGTFMICFADALGDFDAACPCRLAVKLPVRDMLDPMDAMKCS